MAPPSWAALKDRFVVVGGPRVQPTEDHFAAYARSYRRPVPDHYRELMAHFGPGTFNDFVHVAAPHHLATYGERMGLGGPDTTILFASTDNGDELAWSLAGDPGSSPEILANRRARANEFVPFAADCRALVVLVAERNLFAERGPRRPFFVPMRRRQTIRLELVAGAGGSEPGASFQPRSPILARGGGESAPAWSSWTLHLPELDAIAHVQATSAASGHPAFVRWSVRVDWPLDRELDAVRAWVLGEWPGAAGGPLADALAGAKAHVVGIDLV